MVLHPQMRTLQTHIRQNYSRINFLDEECCLLQWMFMWFYGCVFEIDILRAANFQYSLGHEKDFFVLSSMSTINNEIFVFVPSL